MKIAHCADLHLGCRKLNRTAPDGSNQREYDGIQALRSAVSGVLEAKPDAVVIAGDLFDSVRPGNHAIRAMFQELRRLRQGLPQAAIVAIEGNHDRAKESTAGSILPLLGDVTGIHVVVGPSMRLTFPELDLSILAVPDSAINDVEPVRLEPTGPERYQVLVLHGEVDGVITEELAVPQRSGMDQPSLFVQGCEFVHETANRIANMNAAWSYVALGHYHVRTEICPGMWYSGSLDYVSRNPWGELQDEAKHQIPGKGWLLVDLDTGVVTPQPIECPRRFHDCEPIDALDLAPADVSALIRDRIESIPGGIDDAMVRLLVRNIGNDVKRELDYKAIKRFQARAMNLHIDYRRPDRQSQLVTIGPDGRGRTLEAIAAEYFARIGKAHLVTKAVELLQDVPIPEEEAVTV